MQGNQIGKPVHYVLTGTGTRNVTHCLYVYTLARAVAFGRQVRDGKMWADMGWLEVRKLGEEDVVGSLE